MRWEGSALATWPMQYGNTEWLQWAGGCRALKIVQAGLQSVAREQSLEVRRGDAGLHKQRGSVIHVTSHSSPLSGTKWG